MGILLRTPVPAGSIVQLRQQNVMRGSFFPVPSVKYNRQATDIEVNFVSLPFIAAPEPDHSERPAEEVIGPNRDRIGVEPASTAPAIRGNSDFVLFAKSS